MNSVFSLFAGFDWKMLVKFVTPLIRIAGIKKVNEDDNNVGKDDAAGITLIFLADLAEALAGDKPLPAVPATYRAGSTLPAT